MKLIAFGSPTPKRGAFTQTMLVMKLTIIILLIATFQLKASSYGQSITLSEKNASLQKIFKQINKQTGYQFFFNDDLLNQISKVNINVTNAPLNEVLDLCFKDLKITYVITEKAIVVKPLEIEQIKDQVPARALIRIKGKIVNENGEPVAGASIVVKGSKISSAANDLGDFEIDVPNTNSILVISAINIETFETKVDGRTSLNLTGKMKTSSLDQIQVIGYGTTTKRLSTGSISSVKASEIQKQPVSNPLQAISGRAAGVYVNEASGLNGSNVSLVIRGQNTIGASTNPLYIIDGVPFNATPTESTVTAGVTIGTPNVGGGFSPFDNIPASDIENIEILKDADATAIYGSRASNGVVLITTKRGKAGKMSVSANVYSGISKIIGDIKMLNTEQYLDLRRKAFANDNITPTATNAPDLVTFGNGYTNFLNTVMGNTANVTDATINLSGGNQQSQYLISGNFRNQSSVFPNYFAENKGTLRFNMQNKSANGKFSINLSGAYTKNVNTIPTTSASRFYSLPPNLPLYNADGSLYWNNSYTNPVAALLSPNEVKTDNVIANSTIKYNILQGLSFKTDIGFNRLYQGMVTATKLAASNPTRTTGSVTIANNFTQTFTVEPQINFARKIGIGNLEALLGGTYQSGKAVQPLFLLGSFTNDALFKNIPSITPQLLSSGEISTKYVSTFARVNYDINHKYIINLNGRRDGSSRFGPGKQYGNFGSAGLAWIFGDESFVKNNFKWLSFGKIRASYGTVGNDPNQDYLYLSTYRSPGVVNSYSGTAALSPQKIANDDLSWELTKKTEVALDLNFLRNRINFSTAWYNNRSNNLLVNIPVASQSGFSTYVGNLPAEVGNTGWEFTLETKNIDEKQFSWTTSINLTIPKNKLISYPNLASSNYANTYVIGQSLNVVQNYNFTGFINGVAQFADLDKNGTLTSGSFTTTGRGDFQVLGNTDPKFYGGINNSISFKNFNLDFLFTFVNKKAYNIYNFNTVVPGNSTNVPLDILNLPFIPTIASSSPSAISFTRYRTSDAVFTDASFIRLKNISLSYHIKSLWTERAGLKNFLVYFRGQNLITITNYLGIDPETLGQNIPPMKLYTVGFQISL